MKANFIQNPSNHWMGLHMQVAYLLPVRYSTGLGVTDTQKIHVDPEWIHGEKKNAFNESNNIH